MKSYKQYLSNKYIRLLAMSLMIILALIFVQDFADFLGENSDNVVKLGINPNCNSATSICSAAIKREGEFQRISFAIKKTAAAEFPIKLTAVGFDFEGIDSISVSFEMPGEDREEIKMLLLPDKSTHQVVPENWHAVAKLPKVENGRSDWLAIVRLKSSAREYRAEFPCSF